MWCIQKHSCFHLLTFVIFAWMILGIAEASQSDTASAVSGVDNSTLPVVGAGNSTHANCSGIQLSGQLADVAGNDTDAYDVELPLSEQLFEFAQLFSVVNFKNQNISIGFDLNIEYTSFEGMPESGPWECHRIAIIGINCIEPSVTSNKWYNTRRINGRYAFVR